MPHLTGSLPSYRLHEASGQAVVTRSGSDVCLGPHSPAASKREDDRVISEWLAAGRQPAGRIRLRTLRVAVETTARAEGILNRIPGFAIGMSLRKTNF